MRYVILRDDDTNTFTPVECLERLYRPFLDLGLPVNLAVIPNVGAYGLSASLALFLGHPMPTEVVTDGGQVVEATRLAVRRERTRLDSATAVLT